MRGKQLIFNIIFLISFVAQAELQQKYSISYRTTPAGLNPMASLSYDSLLWGDGNKQNPLFGFYKFGIQLAGAPTANVFVELAPIAPLVFSVNKSLSYRFLNSSVFDCNRFYCFGSIDRTDYLIKAAAKFNNIAFVGSYMWRELSTPDSSKPIMLELENFSVLNGNHKYNEFVFFTGYQRPTDDMLGVLYINGKLPDLSLASNSVYAVYHWKHNELSYTVGLGNYSTDQANVGGTSMIFSIGKTIGESLSLF